MDKKEKALVSIIEGYGAGAKGIKKAIKKLGTDIYILDYVEIKENNKGDKDNG